MRNAILRVPVPPAEIEQRTVLRTAMRQLERAEIYLDSVACMDLRDDAAEVAITRLREDLAGLREHLDARRADIQQ